MYKNPQELYCTKCKKTYNNLNPKFKFCPECGNALIINDPELLNKLNSIKNKYKRNICPECLEEFPRHFKHCPICSTPIIEDDRFEVDEENLKLYLKWNDEKVEINLEDELFLPRENEGSASTIDLVFEYKWMIDNSLEYSFINLGEEVPEKLSYEEIIEIVSICSDRRKIIDLKFTNTKPILPNDHTQKEHRVRKNIYAIVMTNA